jgi:hypothetical protein
MLQLRKPFARAVLSLLLVLLVLALLLLRTWQYDDVQALAHQRDTAVAQVVALRLTPANTSPSDCLSSCLDAVQHQLQRHRILLQRHAIFMAPGVAAKCSNPILHCLHAHCAAHL